MRFCLKMESASKRLAGAFLLAAAATALAQAGSAAAGDGLDVELVKQGRAEAETIWRRGYTVDEGAAADRLQALLDTLTAGRDRQPQIELKAAVFRSPDQNAFCLPDGSLYVFSGLLAALDSWDQVGFVVAHEAQHALGWHAQKNIAQAKGKIAALEVLSLGATIGFASSGMSGAFLYDSLTQLGLGLATAAMVSGYGRGLETEADLAAVEMLAEAGRPPCAGVEALQVLMKESDEAPRAVNFFWGSHPLLRDRVGNVAEAVSAGGCPDGGPVAPDYIAVKCEMLAQTARQWAEDRERDKAVAACRRYRELAGETPEILTWQGFAWSQSASADTLDLAEQALQQALTAACPDDRLPLRGLAEVALARRDTVAAIDYLEVYLADDARVPDRRACARRLQALREGKPILEPLPERRRPRGEKENRHDEEF